MNNIFDDEKNSFIKDCPNNLFLPTVIKKSNRVIAIGDIHGDYQLIIDILKLAKVINNSINWIGNDTIVVQVGDQVDRCRPSSYKCNDPRTTKYDEASDIKILKLMNNLHIQAVKNGGAVYSLLGNHELMNAQGNMNYVSLMGLEQFKDYKDPRDPNKTFSSGMDARVHAFKPGNEYGKLLACTRTSALIIGSSIFIHAGLLLSFLDDINIDEFKIDINKLKPCEINQVKLLKINKLVRKWLLGLITPNNIDKIVGSHINTLFWTRTFGNIPQNMGYSDDKCEKYLGQMLKMLKLDHMIIGHTPQFYKNKEGINSTCDNRLWRVDFGGSNAFNAHDKTEDGIRSETRNVQVLEILNDKEFKVLKYNSDLTHLTPEINKIINLPKKISNEMALNINKLSPIILKNISNLFK
jgi:hypothetical protein